VPDVAEVAVGVDFGTTNSAIAVSGPGRDEPELAQYSVGAEEPSPTFRSLLYFEQEPGMPLQAFAGPWAIERYIEGDESGRLMQSLKSFLAARDFSVTNVFGRPYRLEALIGVLLKELRERAAHSLGSLDGPVVVGRPVHFVSARSAEDEELALSRLRAAFYNGGFPEIVFEYEPVAAAYHYERSLDHDELILIADLGGGTSDFCLLQVGPSRRSRSAQDFLLDTDGVAIAGDAFDGSIVRHVVSPHLGLGSQTVSIFGKEMDAPAWIYANLERWHHVSFLRTPRSMQLLHDLVREAKEREKFERLLYLVKQQLGFVLYRSVEQTKRELSFEREAGFDFQHGPLELRDRVVRADFSSWIWNDVEKIVQSADRLLQRHSITNGDVDRVFLTGGSSFVAPLRSQFLERFGQEKIRTGEELTSVASGLALRAREYL